jgi:membrane-bound ClpP family serine protease
METPPNTITDLIEKIEIYGKTTLELTKLKLLELIISIVSSIISHLSVFITLFMLLLILNIGIALFLGDIFGKLYYGFFIVAGFYLILGIIMHFFFQNRIKKMVSNAIIKSTFK